MLDSGNIISYQDFSGETHVNVEYLSVIFNNMMATFSDEYKYLSDDTIHYTLRKVHISVDKGGFVSLSEILRYISKKNSTYSGKSTTLYRALALAKTLYGLKLITKEDMPEYVFNRLFVKKRTNFAKLAVNRAKIIKELKERKTWLRKSA